MRKAVLISLDSSEYSSALELRHQLFFKAHSIPLEETPDADETRSLHTAVPDNQGGVEAYGRLTRVDESNWRISQMVVRPECGRQGLGSVILQKLIDEARIRGAQYLILSARIQAQGFYARFGFTTVGEKFPSKRTGVVHVPMRLDLS